MKILVLWHVTEDADKTMVESLLVSEERFAWNLYLNDELREHYASDGNTPAISILEFDSVELAKEKLSKLPLWEAGLLAPAFYPLLPFANWKLLFGQEETK